jgi:hypothetical protein
MGFVSSGCAQLQRHQYTTQLFIGELLDITDEHSVTSHPVKEAGNSVICSRMSD